MKNTILTTIIFCLSILFPLKSTGQYASIEYIGGNASELKIEQIDQYDFSTIIHFSFLNRSNLRFNGSEDIKIIQNGIEKELLASYNLPLDEKVHMFNDSYESLNFSLEFEKVQDISSDFTIHSSNSSYFNYEKVKIDTVQKKEFLDIEKFIGKTPSREYHVFYHEGLPVYKYAHKGIILMVKLTYNAIYGTYFQPQIVVQNYNRKEVLINPTKIYAQYGIKGKHFNALVIDYRKYLSVVRKKQSNERFFTGLVDGLAAVSAGYSYISASSNTYMTASGRSLNYGFFGSNLYANSSVGSVSGFSNTNISATSYDLGKTFMAAQVARQNMDNLKAQQVQELNSLQSGYIKLNTIFSQSEYEGFCNIPYSRNADTFLMKIEINDNEFFFEWNQEQLNDIRF